jgi:para-aminobenzoate synthetase component I
MVGGAITSQSTPEKEYSECLLKAGAIMKVLQRLSAKTVSPES